MKITIVRHAEPDYSIDSLTQKGRREAQLLSERLGKEQFDGIYCSPLGRAQHTAAPTLAALGASAECCDWLREVNYMQVADPDNSAQQRAIWDFMPRFFGEQSQLHSADEWLHAPIIQPTDIAAQYAEVCNGLDGVLAQHGYHRSGRLYTTAQGNHHSLLFFCHHGAGCVLLSHLINISPVLLMQNFCLLPSSVTTLYTEEREKGLVSLRCSSLGDLSHLYAGGEQPSFAARFCEQFEDDTRH